MLASQYATTHLLWPAVPSEVATTSGARDHSSPTPDQPRAVAMASSVTPGELHADTSQAAPGNSTVAAAATASAAATATAAANAVMDATAGAASAGVSAAAGAAGAASDSSGDSWVPTIVTGLLLFSSFLGYLYFYQESLLYYPKQPIHLTKSNPPEYRSPEFYSIDYRELWATTTDGIKVHTWLLLTKQPRKAPTLIFFHGNAGNMGFRLPNMKRLHDTCQVNILMVDYRGYGHSEGEPSEEGLMLDAEAALDELLKQEDIDPNNIMAFGRSLGGAVATSLAHRRPGALRGLVLENTFTNISAMASKMFPFLDPIQSLVLRMDWPTAARIADLTLPIMLVSVSVALTRNV